MIRLCERRILPFDKNRRNSHVRTTIEVELAAAGFWRSAPLLLAQCWHAPRRSVVGIVHLLENIGSSGQVPNVSTQEVKREIQLEQSRLRQGEKDRPERES